jgi:hypothetical protein
MEQVNEIFFDSKITKCISRDVALSEDIAERKVG